MNIGSTETTEQVDVIDDVISEMRNYRGYVEEYMKLMKIGQSLPIEGRWFRCAYPAKSNYSHHDVFLSDTPGARYGAFTLEYDKAHDHYIIHRNEFSNKLVYVEPPERSRYRRNREGFWERRIMI